MRPSRLFPLLALLVAACAAGHRPADPAAAAALHWTLETREARFLGSATALGPGCLLTNRHVLRAARGRPLVARRGPVTLAVAAAVASGRDDAALLHVPGLPAALPAARRGPLAAGEPLAVAGALSGTPRVEIGSALDPAGASVFGQRMQGARLPVAPGFSGGPVVDAEGRLVGIVVAAAAGSLAEAQRLAANGRSLPLRPRTTILLPVDAALGALTPGACGAPA